MSQVSPEVIEEIKEKLTRFGEEVTREGAEHKLPVVYCMNCGSVNIDQNSVSQLQCYNCRETSLWNGRKFGIARGAHPADVRNALLPAEVEGYWDNWYAHAVESLYDFGKKISEAMPVTTAIRSTASVELRPEEYAQIKASWEETKRRIDSLLE